jgi:hypothetical protein
MTLQQTSFIDKIEIIENNVIQVRERTDIYNDTEPTVIISSAYKRWVLNPGDETTGQDPKVISITTLLWTPAVIAAYQATLKINNLIGT